MKMRKWLAFLLAGVMVLSLSTVAFAEMIMDSNGNPFLDQNGQPITVPDGSCGGDSDSGNSSGSSSDSSSSSIGGSSIGGCDAPVVEYVEPLSAAEAEQQADALAAEAMGIPQTTLYAAAAEGKSVGEYSNNAIISTPGLAETTPVAQGGNVIINGQATNQTFSVGRVLPAHVDYAKAQAAAVGGKVLNVVDIKGSVRFETATVNFYMPGVVAGQNIQVYQYAGGQWIAVNVAEIREDHVVVDMTSYGVLSFVEVQNAEAVEAADVEAIEVADAEAEAEIAAVEAEAAAQ